MMGLALGAVAILGFAAVRRAHHRRAWAWYHHGWHGGYGCGPGWHRGPAFGAWAFSQRPWLWHVLARLDLSPAQEKLIRQEVDQLAERLRTLRSELKAARGDVGRAVSGDVFDQGALDAMFLRHDQALGELRTAVTASLARVHEALDERQREALGELLGGAAFRGAGFGGPYRM